jgi:hypothetical protein
MRSDRLKSKELPEMLVGGRFLRPLLAALTIQFLVVACNGRLGMGGSDTPTTEDSPKGYLSVMSLPPPDQLEIWRLMGKGLPVFRWKNGELQSLSGCYFPGTLEYTDLGVVHGSSDGAKTVAVGVDVGRIASVGAKHDTRSAADVVVVGALESPLGRFQVGSLHEQHHRDCEGATHVAAVIQVGAYATGDSNETEVRGGVGVAQAGVSANLAKSEASFAEGGRGQDCGSAPSAGDQRRQCNAPLYVKLVALEESDQFEYWFDDGVRGARTEDSVVTAEDVATVGKALAHELALRSRAEGVEVSAVPAPSETNAQCNISASTSPNEYLLTCKRGDRLILQQSGDRRALKYLIPKAAGTLLDSVDPTEPPALPAVAGRVVVLVDVSLSMVVNDEAAYTTDDIRRSKRYELVMLMLRGMQDNGIKPEVAVVTFSGAGCMRPVVFEGEKLWSLTDESRDHALDQLQGSLERVQEDCPDGAGTDLASPLRLASELLGGAKSSSGKDVVILVTDGVHQAQGHRDTPQKAAVELRKIGAELTVVRVQLNDLTGLRTKLKGPSKQDILDRWARFLDNKGWVDRSWEHHWLKDFPAENDEGNTLLTNLDTIEISRIFLSSNDAESNPLLTAHEILLPQLGGLEPVFSSNAATSEPFEGRDGNPVVETKFKPRIVRGRPFALRIKKPECMGRVVNAKLEAASHEATMLRVLWEDGGIVTFETTEVEPFPGDQAGGTTVTNEARLTVYGEPMRGAQCQN